jgi:flagellar protein FlbD
MISVTKLSGKEITVNVDLIKTIEMVPDTIIALTNGEKLLVAESRDEIVMRVIEYKSRIEERSRILV